MIDFTHIKYGMVISLMAILFGGLLGLSFGCCEDDIKQVLKSRADGVLAEKYEGDPELAGKVVEKSWVYLKRAHLHSQTMGVIAIAFSLLAAGLRFKPKFQLAISILAGFGALGYGVFWLSAAWLAPAMGSTGAAKEAVGIVAQISGGAFFVAGVSVFSLVIYQMFIRPSPSRGSSETL